MYVYWMYTLEDTRKTCPSPGAVSGGVLPPLRHQQPKTKQKKVAESSRTRYAHAGPEETRQRFQLLKLPQIVQLLQPLPILQQIQLLQFNQLLLLQLIQFLQIIQALRLIQLLPYPFI